MEGAGRSFTGVAAVRGAVTVAGNSAEAILAATARLLEELMRANRLEKAQVVSALFTATPDLDADFPAHAARRLGWSDVPLLCAREIAVPGAPAGVVRVLLTVAGAPIGARLAPVYLDGAAALRPDLAPPAAGPARSVAIVGLGQIGGSIGLALAGRGWRRAGWDRDADAVARALAVGAIDEAAAGLEAACAAAEVAVLAVPVDALAEAIDRAAAALPRGAALVDTGSARGPLTAALERAARRGVAAVGGHPLAGGEGRGLGAARGDLFRGARFALLPCGAGVPPIVRDLVAAIGAEPLEVTPAVHDAALARTSHLPYLVASALRGVGGRADAEGLSGPGFRGMTRLAASDPAMAGAYCRANAAEIAAAWRELRAEIDARVAGLGGG